MVLLIVNFNVLFCSDESGAASLGRGRRSAATNRSRQQLQRERALHMAARHTAPLSDSPLSPEQQLQPTASPTPPSAPTQPPPPASCQAIPDKIPKHDVHQEEPDPVQLSSEDPAAAAAAVKELDKQEVELLVSLMQGWFLVIWFSLRFHALAHN